MQRRNLQLGWFLLVAPVSVIAEQTPIVLIEPVRIAFLEHAPRALESSMRNAIERKCKNESENRDSPTATPLWYCTETELRFLRQVNVLGNVYNTGLACHPDDLTPNLKYYLEDMFDDSERCIYVAHDVDTDRHYIDEDEK